MQTNNIVKAKIKTIYIIMSVVLFTLIVSIAFLCFFADLDVANQYPDKYTSFYPFSGKLFNLKSEDVAVIEFHTNNSFEPVRYVKGEKAFDEVLNYINSFRYESHRPNPSINEYTGNVQYYLYIRPYAGSVEGTCWYGFNSREFEVNSVWYCSDNDEYFKRLIELAEKRGEETWE